MLKVVGAVYSDTGRVRETNEDNLYWQGQFRKPYELVVTLDKAFTSEESLQLYAVSDGMGGMARGELASRLALSEMASLEQAMKKAGAKEDINLLDIYLRERSSYIWERNRNAGSLDEAMGATISLLLLRDNKAVLANMGDTAVYQCREGLLKQLSRDDSHAARLRSLGYLTREEASRHPFKNSLINFLGKEQPGDKMNYFLVPDITLAEGDLLLLCSDGISGSLNRETIQLVLNDEQSVPEKVRTLVDMALEAGSQDNITAILLRVVACGPADGKTANTTFRRPTEAEDLAAYDAIRGASSPQAQSKPVMRAFKLPETSQVYGTAGAAAESQSPRENAETALKPGQVAASRVTLAPKAEEPPKSLPIKPVRVFSDHEEVDSIEPWPSRAAEKAGPKTLSDEQLAYYNRAREAAIKRQAERAVSGEEKGVNAQKPVSGQYTRPAAQPAPGAQPQAARPAKTAPVRNPQQPQPNPASRTAVSREAKQRMYDERYSSRSDAKAYANGNKKARPQGQAPSSKRKRSGIFEFLNWLAFLIIFVLIGFALTFLLIKFVPMIA